MTRPLTKSEERAEAALWRAREWHAHDDAPPRRGSWIVEWGHREVHLWPRPALDLLNHLIDIGRVYP